jgi:hypothetical protein
VLHRAVKVRLEVLEAVARRSIPVTSAPPADALRPPDLPSSKELGDADRIVAEIDQDGYAFAVHPADTAVFNRRAEKLGRLRYGIRVVLRQGEIVVEKRFTRGTWFGLSIGHYVFGQLHIPFFNEAAALVRLRRIPGVPRLRHVDLGRHTLYMDYIHGETLQKSVAERGAKILDADGAGFGALDESSRDDREVAAFFPERDAHRQSIARIFGAILAAGVAPLDVKLGNVVVGARTGALHWLDFEIAHLASLPDHANAEALARERVERWFGVTPADLAAAAVPDEGRLSSSARS